MNMRPIKAPTHHLHWYVRGQSLGSITKSITWKFSEERITMVKIGELRAVDVG